MLEYAAALSVCAALACLCGQGRHQLCAAVLVVNFVANQALVSATGDATAWWWFSLTDLLAAAVLTTRFSGKIGGVLAATFATQVLMHWSFAISPNPHPYLYWQSLTAMAWLQLAILLAGGIGNGCHRLSALRRRPLGASSKDHSRVGSTWRGGN